MCTYVGLIHCSYPGVHPIFLELIMYPVKAVFFLFSTHSACCVMTFNLIYSHCIELLHWKLCCFMFAFFHFFHISFQSTKIKTTVALLHVWSCIFTAHVVYSSGLCSSPCSASDSKWQQVTKWISKLSLHVYIYFITGGWRIENRFHESKV